VGILPVDDFTLEGLSKRRSSEESKAVLGSGLEISRTVRQPEALGRKSDNFALVCQFSTVLSHPRLGLNGRKKKRISSLRGKTSRGQASLAMEGGKKDRRGGDSKIKLGDDGRKMALGGDRILLWSGQGTRRGRRGMQNLDRATKKREEEGREI